MYIHCKKCYYNNAPHLQTYLESGNIIGFFYKTFFLLICIRMSEIEYGTSNQKWNICWRTISSDFNLRKKCNFRVSDKSDFCLDIHSHSFIITCVRVNWKICVNVLCLLLFHHWSTHSFIVSNIIRAPKLLIFKTVRVTCVFTPHFL